MKKRMSIETPSPLEISIPKFATVPVTPDTLCPQTEDIAIPFINPALNDRENPNTTIKINSIIFLFLKT